MDFSWSPDVRLRIERTRQCAAEQLAPLPQSVGFDQAAWNVLAALDLFRIALPTSWGGENCGALVTIAVLEALGRGGADRGLLFAAGAHLFGCAVPVAAYGSARHAETWSKALSTGAVIGALAVTEAAGGSSLDLLTTEAVKTPDGYVLAGEKTLVANAPVAGIFLVLARQYPDRGPLGLTAFLVPRDTPGLTVNPITSGIGLPGAPLGSLRFADCFLPHDAVIGSPGAGLRIFATAMQWERTCLLAGFLGAAERDLSSCLEALRGRRDAHGSLLRHQGVSHRLARIKLSLESARLLAYRAAWSIDQGHDDYAAAAMAKLAMSEAVVEAALDSLRLMAGSAWRRNGMNWGAGLNDAVGGLFASGTSEVQLDIVARQLQLDRRGK